MKNSEINRRQVLTSSLAGGSIMILPVEWSRPLVHSVLLPAHAQLSGTCIPDGSLTTITTPIIDDVAPDIAILFDGKRSCGLFAFDQDDNNDPANAVIIFDIDTDDGETWDYQGPGSDWTITELDGIVPGENPDGTYTIEASGFGNQFSITFTIEVAALSGGRFSMTISNVTISPL